MGISSQRTPPKKRRERSIFGSIFNALMLVVLVEVLLLVASIYLMRVGPQLNHNAEDILAMQVETRSGYIQSQLNDAQELSSLTSRINTLTQELLDSGAIDLATLDSSSDAAYPLLAAVTPKLISTLRSKSVTGIYLILNTHDLNERASGDRLPSVYLRDLDPDSPPPENNSDLMFERAPARLVQTQNIATDKAWKPAITYRFLGAEGLVYSSFQTAYDAETKLDATAYGHWTTSPYVMNGDDRQAIAYSLPLILPDGTVYGVVGVELLTSYLTEKMPYNELHTSNSGSYALCYSSTTLNADTLTLTAFPVMNSGGLDLSTALQLTRAGADCFRFSKNNISYIASLVPLEVYSRNAPFYGEHWCLVGIVPSSALFAFAQRVQQLLFLTVLLTLIAGFAASWLVSERMSKPVAQLSAEVAKAQNAAALPQLSTTGIAEVDQFASAISQLSSDMLASSTRFLRIMEMASVELAGYELRNDSVYVTDNFFRMLGVQRPDPLTPSSFRAALSTVAHSSLYRTTSIGSSFFTIAQPDGNVQYIVLRITRIVAQTPSEVGLLEDVTSAILEQQRIERERDYDILTGLYSRQAFNRVCADLFAHPDRLRCAALLMMDLDNLKHINDTYGHDWGDQYIRRTGQCLRDNTPAGTVCARLSGDEFLVLFHGYRSRDAVREKIDCLTKAMQQSVALLPSGNALHISLSGGIAWYPDDGQDWETLKKYADFAMYQVKHSEKGRVEEFDIGVYNREAYAERTRREFRQLLSNAQVFYCFQPIFSARSGRVVAYEALMRSDLPTLRSPATIMKLAREQGALYEIERLTFTTALETFDSLCRAGSVSGEAMLFVNSIASTCLTQADVDYIDSRWHELRRRMVIEITEEEAIDYEALERKRNAPGFSGMFALDDYGSGYSNENTLLQLAPRFVKVDITIIRGIDTSPDKQQILRNMVAYAHPRSMKIVAEGVETAAELRTVIELGADLLQGYFLARPAIVPGAIAPEAAGIIQELQRRKKD